MRQLEVVSRRLPAELAATTPVPAEAAVTAHLDIDSTQRRVYGHAEQGAGFGEQAVDEIGDHLLDDGVVATLGGGMQPATPPSRAQLTPWDGMRPDATPPPTQGTSG